MLNIKRHACPVDYRLCNQTVTVYHCNGGSYIRTVYEKRAFLDFRKTQNVDKTGSKEANSFLLVIPGDTIPVAVGDKVMHGVGPDNITTAAAWASFIPSKVQGLAVVKYVDPKYWNDQLVHTEAGG